VDLYSGAANANSMMLNGAVSAGRDITAISKGTLEAAGLSATEGNIDLASVGAMTLRGVVNAAAGDVTANSEGRLTTGAAVTGYRDVILTSANAMDLTGGKVTATTGDLTAKSRGGWLQAGALEAGNNIDLASGNDMTLNGDVNAGRDVTANS
jgi:hypothetical protein